MFVDQTNIVMTHPFKVIRGGQVEAKPVPKEFAKFDHRQAEMEAIKARHIANRDKTIRKNREREASLNGL